MRIGPLDEAVAMHTDVQPRGQFGANLLVDQADRIIAGMRDLATVVEA